MMEIAAGQVLGRYELLLPIARGGMAQVWAARLCGTRGFQKIVAIKTILAGTIDNARIEGMFLEEATLASQIHHANVVGTLELGEHEGMLYQVMEWVDGEPLNYVMSRAAANGGLPLSVAVSLIAQVCKGLHAAHELRDDSGALLGLVHRDVSPQNILVTPSGIAKLVDFGIAKATNLSSGLTSGELKGKFAYMAPEQVAGQPIDRRTDIFALGVVLYLLTTGKHAFKGENAADTLRSIYAKTPVLPPSGLVADYPAELEAVVLKALQKTPDKRWATAHDMLLALEGAMPHSLEGSFQTRVSSYVTTLIGERISERKAQIRRAQQAVDRLRNDGTSEQGSDSCSSLAALSIDRKQPAATANHVVDDCVVEVVETFISEDPRARGRWRSVLVAAASMLVTATIGWSVLRVAGPSASSSSATIPPVAPMVSLSVPVPTLSASVVASASAPLPVTKDVSQDSKELRAKSTMRERKAVVSRTRRGADGKPSIQALPPSTSTSSAASDPFAKRY